METKVLRKDANWKKKRSRKNKKKREKNRSEETFRSSCMSLLANASTSAVLKWGLSFPTLPKRIRPVA